MCGGSAEKFIKDAQREADNAIRGVQQAVDSAVNQATGGSGGITIPRLGTTPSGGKSSGGVNFPTVPSIITPPLQEAVETVTAPVVETVVETVTAPVVETVEEVAQPVEQIAQTAVQAATPVVEAAVEAVQQPVRAVEEIAKIDVPNVVVSVAQETVKAPVRAAETVLAAAAPVEQAVGQVIKQPVRAVEEIAKIDVPKVAETVVQQAAQVPLTTAENVAKVELAAAEPVFNLGKIDFTRDFNELTDNFNEALGQTFLEVGKAAQPVLGAVSALNPFGGTGGGSGGGGAAQYDVQQPDLDDDQTTSDLEKATGKDSKLTEEERLRRIRRLLLNRYGRSDTILTSGPGDTRSRRRYAL